VLRFWEDLSVEATAAALGCSTGNVKSQTARALAKLRLTLGADPVAGPAHEDPAKEPKDDPQGPLVTIESVRPGGARL
jgi:hypothetical protein